MKYKLAVLTPVGGLQILGRNGRCLSGRSSNVWTMRDWRFSPGQRLGELTVLERVGSYTRVRCSCGVEKAIRSDVLAARRHCGCLAMKPAIGVRFGEVIVVAQYRREGRSWVSILCGCGMATEALKSNVTTGKTTSCGQHHLNLQTMSERLGVSHKELRRLSQQWTAMRVRCLNPTSTRWHRYGGRGISVCPDWGVFETFATWAFANGYGPALTLDRIDNDGDYSPSNCRWATDFDQARNKSTNFWIEAFGERKILADWLVDARCVVRGTTLQKRVGADWSPEAALTTPPRTSQMQSA